MPEKQQIKGCCYINGQVFKCLLPSSTFLSLVLLFLIFLSANFCLTIIEIQRRQLMNKQKKSTTKLKQKMKKTKCNVHPG